MKVEKDDRKPHILTTSANLLGFCFFVLTSVKIAKLEEFSDIDESAAFAIMIFICSYILSFIAMRSKDLNLKKIENSADTLFLFG